MAKKKEVVQKKLVMMYIPKDRVRKFWLLHDAYQASQDGANMWELYNLLTFISRCFNGMDTTGWEIDMDDVMSPYIYLVEEE